MLQYIKNFWKWKVHEREDFIFIICCLNYRVQTGYFLFHPDCKRHVYDYKLKNLKLCDHHVLPPTIMISILLVNVKNE